MSPLEPLPADQRAVVALVLRQGRSYEDIAALLELPLEAVRSRAHAGLAALAPANGLPGEITAPLADYLLGQQPPPDAEATRGLLAESNPARAWASGVAARLADVAARDLPEIPGDAAENPTPATAGTTHDVRVAGAAAAGDTRLADAALAPGYTPVADDTPAKDDTSEAAGAPAAVAADPPGGAADPAAASPHLPREPAPTGRSDAPPASRLGGALLIGGVLAALAVVLVLVLRGGDDDEGRAASAGAAATATATPTVTATATPTAAPAQVTDRIALRAAGGGGRAKGTMTVYLQEDRLLFALEASGVPASRPSSAYAVWFTRPGAKARRLGFTNPVGSDGALGIQGPSDKDLAAFPKLYASYAAVVVSEETTETARRPGRIVLTGRLPGGR